MYPATINNNTFYAPHHVVSLLHGAVFFLCLNLLSQAPYFVHNYYVRAYIVHNETIQ